MRRSLYKEFTTDETEEIAEIFDKALDNAQAKAGRAQAKAERSQQNLVSRQPTVTPPKLPKTFQQEWTSKIAPRGGEIKYD